MDQPRETLQFTGVQMKIGPDKQQNLMEADRALRQAANCHLAALPEMFCCPYQINGFPMYAEDSPSSPARAFLSAAARERQCWIVGGSVPEKEQDALYNTSFVTAPDGAVAARHRKVHLFDVDIAEGPAVQESSILKPGTHGTTFDLGQWRIGVAICYDIRFPEFIQAYADAGAHLLVLPAVFNSTTGKAHWRELLRMRAVDCQMYVAGISPAATRGGSYEVWGHSVIADPWGRVLAEAGPEEAILEAELSLAVLQQVRSNMPLREHRRASYPVRHWNAPGRS